jgi:DNA (cytosine-5)-methyltransferase 1
MNEVSLFTGVGGGLLATKWLLDWRTIAYVEWDDYCQRIIAQRIRDGLLDEAPIFSDIRAFIGEGYAERYRGMVDILTAGFPCQPFSVAGKQKGERDERNMWPQTIECIRIIRPRYALLENVPGLLANKYIRRIYGNLAEAGYDARWCVLGADDCGGWHHRKRWWLLAYSKSINRDGISINSNIKMSKQEFWGIKPRGSVDNLFDEIRNKFELFIHKSTITRMDNGNATYVDRLKAIGNGQVPAVVRAVWGMLRNNADG